MFAVIWRYPETMRRKSPWFPEADPRMRMLQEEGEKKAKAGTKLSKDVISCRGAAPWSCGRPRRAGQTQTAGPHPAASASTGLAEAQESHFQ